MDQETAAKIKNVQSTLWKGLRTKVFDTPEQIRSYVEQVGEFDTRLKEALTTYAEPILARNLKEEFLESYLNRSLEPIVERFEETLRANNTEEV